MDYIKTLRNNNRILSETRAHRSQTQCTSDLSLKFALSGNETYQVGKRELSIYPDSFLMLNKGTQYTSRIDSDVPVESFSIIFDQGFLHDFSNAYTLSANKLLDQPGLTGSSSIDFNETIYPFAGDMRFNIQHLKNHLDNGLQDELLINEYLHHSLINYYRVYNNEVYNKADKLNFTNRSTRIEILKRLNIAKDFMYTNYNRNISLEELGRQACLSVNHLLRTFKQAFSLSPHQFLIQLRLQRARILLRTTQYPINEIVCLVGFECPSSFIRLFKAKYFITPQKYRQALI
ncbi:AraC family transcriptional regulator [Mucilaginibacter sp. PPCGB 2223]|uniref:helix-turn-helix domain-containing protein n=1 Tax=Mucilaginibacter sp. PPCGB 2223 TaxID=1886027 RepID=UPI000824279F|nr:AraC family transcriptional regulator [Mucilaginibacter sp. PPCGB 2223]OCX52515.1 AraC family transcriptional regulator [Mucilaginibacter sp. PPCGB 2223]